MRQILSVATVLLFLPTYALAEVCDKEVPNWNSADGSVSSLESFVTDFGNPYVIAVFALALLAFFLRTWWLLLIAGTLCAFMAMIFVVDPIMDDIYRASIREGCRTAPVLQLFVFSLLAIVCAALLSYSAFQRLGRS